MKIILLIFFLIYSPYVFGNNKTVYYCSETDSVGFFQDENYKFSKIKRERFKVLIDFENKFIRSEHLFFGSYDMSKCFTNLEDQGRFLICTNEWGKTVVMNEKNLKFKLSSLPTNESDTIVLSYGKCEKF